MHKRTNNFPVYRVLGNLALSCVEMCVLGDRWATQEFLTRGRIWWRHVCSSDFLEEFFSEIQFPALVILGNPYKGSWRYWEVVSRELGGHLTHLWPRAVNDNP
jgi:hypothetical protein